MLDFQKKVLKFSEKNITFAMLFEKHKQHTLIFSDVNNTLVKFAVI
jgi:hypothetical protein